MKNETFQKIKSFADAYQTYIAKSVLLSRLYLFIWRVILKILPSGKIKEHIINGISNQANWPFEHYSPRNVHLVGSPRPIRLAPHPGMMDFSAMCHSKFEYEPEVVHFLEGHLAGIDNVIEIGANIGIFTLYFSNYFSARGNGHVYSFEPAPHIYRAMLDNIFANNSKNVTPINAAVFNRAGIAKFFESNVSTRSSLIEGHASYGAHQVSEYSVFTVDSAYLEPLLKGQGQVLIKIDIEGAEKDVLRSLEALLLQYRPHIIMEALFNDCEQLNELEFLLQSYKLFHLTDRGPIEHPKFIGDSTYRFRDYLLLPR